MKKLRGEAYKCCSPGAGTTIRARDTKDAKLEVISMIEKVLKNAHPGQIIALVILLGLLVFFLKDSGITDILIVIGAAVIMGLILVPWSEVEAFDREDIIDWKLINRLSNKGE